MKLNNNFMVIIGLIVVVAIISGNGDSKKEAVYPSGSVWDSLSSAQYQCGEVAASASCNTGSYCKVWASVTYPGYYCTTYNGDAPQTVCTWGGSYNYVEEVSCSGVVQTCESINTISCNAGAADVCKDANNIYFDCMWMFGNEFNKVYCYAGVDSCTYGCSNGACNAAPTPTCASVNMGSCTVGAADVCKDADTRYFDCDWALGDTSNKVYCYLGTEECPYGCLNGACKSSSGDGCAETDNGVDYYNQGTTTLVLGANTFSDTDVCSTSTTLLEFFCNGISKGQSSYDCPNGCSNGACTQVGCNCAASSQYCSGVTFADSCGTPNVCTGTKLYVCPDPSTICIGTTPQPINGCPGTCNPGTKVCGDDDDDTPSSQCMTFIQQCGKDDAGNELDCTTSADNCVINPILYFIGIALAAILALKMFKK